MKNVVAVVILALVVGGAILISQRHRASVGRGPMEMEGMVMGPLAPVETEKIAPGLLESTVTYTGSVVPFVEEDVYPRVTGRIVAMPVYAGDTVRAGQVIAQLDSAELSARLQEAHHAAEAARAAVTQAEIEEGVARSARVSAEANRRQTEADVVAAVAGREQAEHEIAGARADEAAALAARRQAEQEVAAVQAELEYWQSQFPRQEALLKVGAISRQEFDMDRSTASVARTKRDLAGTKVVQMEAGLVGARARVAAAEAKARQMRDAIASAEARIAAARAAEEQARLTTDGARARVGTARSQAEQARSGHAAQEIVRGYTTITASTSGVVMKRLVSPGVLIQPGMPILKIARVDTARVQANVAAKDLDAIRVGTPVGIRAPGGTTAALRARVTAVFPAIDPVSRTAIVEAAVANGAHFVPGQYVVMDFVTDRREAALTVPREAIVTADGASAVFVADGDVARRRNVTVGIRGQDRVEIMSGLSAGDEVIVRGVEGLTEGMRLTRAGEAERAPTAQAPGMQIALTTAPSPPTVGPATLRASVKDAAGTPVADADVTFAYAMTMPGMPSAEARARRTGAAQYEATAQFAMAGEWRITVSVGRSGQSLGRQEFTVRVQERGAP